jgi:hypothetical protein
MRASMKRPMSKLLRRGTDNGLVLAVVLVGSLIAPRPCLPDAPPADNWNGTAFVGGMSDPLPKPARGGRQYAQASETGALPAPANGAWRIEMRYVPIAHLGHSFLVLVDPSGETRGELHGLSEFISTRHYPFGSLGAKLRARSFRYMPLVSTIKVADAAAGSYDDIVVGIWARGLKAADEINKHDFDYNRYDPDDQVPGVRGQTQNGNSVVFTIEKAMGLMSGSRNP